MYIWAASIIGDIFVELELNLYLAAVWSCEHNA